MTSNPPKPVEVHLDPYEGKVVLAKRGLLGFGWCCAPKDWSIEQVQTKVHQQIEPYIPDLGDGEVTPWTVVRREHENPEWVSPGRCADSEHRQHWFMIGGLSGVFLLANAEDNEGIDPETEIQTHQHWQAANAN